MIPGITFDDGSLIGEDELNNIEARVKQCRYGATDIKLEFGPGDSAAQAASDRARLFCLLEEFEASPKWRKI